MPEPSAPQSSEATAAGTPGPLLDAAGIRRTLTRLAHEIVEANAGVENLVLVGIQRRGVTLVRRIADAIESFENPPATGSLDVTMHRDDFDRRGLRGTPEPTQLQRSRARRWSWSTMCCLPVARFVRRWTRSTTTGGHA